MTVDHKLQTKMGTRIATFLATAAALALPCAAQAAETLYIGSFGGSIQKVFEQSVIPAFEAKTGAKVVYVPGNSSDTLSKLMAQKSKQELSVALMDDGMMFVALENGLCAPLEDAKVVNDLYPAARLAGGKAAGFAFYSTGLAYNKQVFAKNGWKEPTSWLDLADPKYKGKVAMGSIGSYGQFALVMLARSSGGGETNIDPGFEAMKRVAANVLAWESSQANLARLLQTGEAALVVWGNNRTQGVIDQGAPVAFVYPKEGAFLGMVTGCVVNGAPQSKLGQQFMQEILSPATQALLAKESGLGPANSKASLTPEVASKVVYGPEQIKKLVAPNWTVINQKRPEWTNRWNREIER